MSTAALIEAAEPTLQTTFDEQQLTDLTKLSYIAYAGSYIPAPFGVENMVRLRLAEFAPEYSLAWGPVALKSQLWDLYTVTLVYVVQRQNAQNETEYTVVFRGTNPLSWTSIFIQDMALKQQIPWTIASPAASRKESPIPANAGVVAAGANVTLNKLKTISYGGNTLGDFLMSKLRAGERVTFTGHSLGGLSAMMYPVWLINECSYKNIEVNGLLSIGALAAPTAGDVLFAEYSEQLFKAVDCKFTRIVNTLDIVNITWNKSRMATELAGLYLPDISPTASDQNIIANLYNLANDCDYAQPSPENTYRFDVGIMAFPDNAFIDLSDRIAKLFLPYGEWPYTWYMQSLAQHSMGYAEYFLQGAHHHRLKQTLAPEMAFITNGAGLVTQHLRGKSMAA